MNAGNDFLTWVITETERHGWSYSELARRMGITPAGVTRVVNGERAVTYDFCMGIARIFDRSPEGVLRVAGLLPPLPPTVAEEQEIVRIVRGLSSEARTMILKMLRGLNNRQPSPPSHHLQAQFPPSEYVDDKSEEDWMKLWNRIWDKTPDAAKHTLVLAIQHAVESYQNRVGEEKGEIKELPNYED